MISLTKNSTGWVAKYTGTDAIEIKRLFGTTTLPTAFGARASAETVLKAIRALNPRTTVVVE